MSGGGHEGGPGGPDIVIDTLDPCENLDFTAHLQSPNVQAVALINVGQVLQVVLQQDTSVAVVDSTGATVGFLLNQLARLLRCLQAGHTFQAEILTIAGGSVKVRVRST